MVLKIFQLTAISLRWFPKNSRRHPLDRKHAIYVGHRQVVPSAKVVKNDFQKNGGQARRENARVGLSRGYRVNRSLLASCFLDVPLDYLKRTNHHRLASN